MVAERLARGRAKLTQGQRAEMHLSRSLIFSAGRRDRCRARTPYLTDSKAVIAQCERGERGGDGPDFAPPGGLWLPARIAIGVRLTKLVELQDGAEKGAGGYSCGVPP